MNNIKTPSKKELKDVLEGKKTIRLIDVYDVFVSFLDCEFYTYFCGGKYDTCSDEPNEAWFWNKWANFCHRNIYRAKVLKFPGCEYIIFILLESKDKKNEFRKCLNRRKNWPYETEKERFFMAISEFYQEEVVMKIYGGIHND